MKELKVIVHPPLRHAMNVSHCDVLRNHILSYSAASLILTADSSVQKVKELEVPVIDAHTVQRLCHLPLSVYELGLEEVLPSHPPKNKNVTSPF